MARITCMFKVLLGLAALCTAGLAIAADADLPAGGKDVFPGDPIAVYKVTGDPALIPTKIVDVQGPGFTKALEAAPQKGLETTYAAQYAAIAQQPIQKGDVMHVRLYSRCIKSMTGTAQVGVVFELNHDPWSKSLDGQSTVGTEWTVLDFPFIAKRDYAAGESIITIRLGYPGQIFQIAGIRVLNYGQGFDKSKLPVTHISYAGREADAPWRKAAEQRIDQIRKADLQVTVKDAVGKPVPNAKVHVQMLRHEFLWGTCISGRPMLGESADDIRYRETLKKYFNHAVIENDLKWQNIDRRGYASPDKEIAWLRDNNISVRGHNLIWPAKEYLPKNVADMLDKPADLRAACDAHITETAARYTGKLVDWDVINEAYANHAVQDVLGNAEMVRWFKLAKAADPVARLYINDYAILASDDRIDTPHQNSYYETIKYLLDNGAPLEGIGMQGHFGTNITSPDHLIQILDRFAAFKLPIKVTELDMKMDDEDARADYMRDLTTVLFSHPAVAGVLQWGFWERSHWIPESAIIDKNWNLRPHGKVWVDLVHRQWKTDVELATDANGVVRVRGFKGDYEVTATDGKITATQSARLSTGGATLICTLGQ